MCTQVLQGSLRGDDEFSANELSVFSLMFTVMFNSDQETFWKIIVHTVLLM